MAERMIFQSAFSLKMGVGERVSEFPKKIIAMSSVKHRDVVAKSSRCLSQTIRKTFLYHREDFFYTCLKKKKKHYDVFSKAL
jgi:hypothetical protein